MIEPSRSEWSSPVVIVPKKDGTLRVCIDFRKLNAQSRFDAYPMPRIDDLLERIGQARYITTLDLCKGYWQVPLDNDSKQYTAFRTPSGLYHFTVLPFGLHSPWTVHTVNYPVLDSSQPYILHALSRISCLFVTIVWRGCLAGGAGKAERLSVNRL